MRTHHGPALRLLLGAALLSGCAEPVDPPSPLAASIDSILSVALDDGPLAGASVAVVRGGEPIFQGFYGLADVERGLPVTADTRFNVASVAKIIAAATVLRLAEEGRLSLDQPVVELLPELEGRAVLEGVQVRHLLDMTSGLPDYVSADLERWLQTREPLDPSFVLDELSRSEKVFDPGEQWMYTNTGFYLAGLIVERVAAAPWAEVVDAQVVSPLGLRATGLCDEMGAERSIGYEATDSGFVRSVQDAERGVRGDAGLCTTATELALLPDRLRSDGLTAASLQRMLAPTRLLNGTGVDYGLGVARGRLFGRNLWGHLGGSGSIVAALYHFVPDTVSVAVVVNTRQASLGGLELVADVAAAVLAVGSPSLPTAIPGDASLAAFEGRFVGDRSRTEYQMRVVENALVRSEPGDPESALALTRIGPLEFGRADWPLDRFLFHRMEGAVTGYSAYYNGIFDGYYARRD
ncbi:serine hydrolase domain-containing protein [Gemmatimonadota bacterium Y43]|uniref:serine hydrolase domain-containing protein n=1 Tax=Gaopeijia maritima TaxID=3119007 RepID=UPI003290862E